MFKLILMRHSIAVPYTEDAEDFSRDLTIQGKKNCQEVAEILKNNDFIPDLVLVSSSVRTMQTIEELNKVLNITESNIKPMIGLYNVKCEEILKIISDQDSLFKNILVISHNPSISKLANLFSNQDYSFYFEPAGFAVFTLDIENWQKILTPCAKMNYLKI